MIKKLQLEIIVSIVTLGAIVVMLFQLPLHAGAHDRLTPILFAIFGILSVAIGIIARHQYLDTAAPDTSKTKQKQITFYKSLPYWALPLVVFILFVPWVFAGTFNDIGMNIFGWMGILLLLTFMCVPSGILALMVGWVPLEITGRSIGKLVTTRGKEGAHQLASGLYFMLCQAAVIVGFFAATTERSGLPAERALVQVLLGQPGDYTIKDPQLLWVARLLFVLMIILPLLYGWISRAKKRKA